MRNVTLNVQGRRCMHCVTSIESALQQIGATMILSVEQPKETTIMLPCRDKYTM